MAAIATSDDFLAALRESNLLDKVRLADAIRFLEQTADVKGQANRSAAYLVRAGYLTEFQARTILAGRSRSLTLGKYRVLDQLGTGGYGTVYLCENALLKRTVAIKVLPGRSVQDPATLGRFYREARAAAAVDHPNVVRAFDIDQDGERHYFVMEYVDGICLHDLVVKETRLPVGRAVDYIRQAAVGLQAIHQAGLVHRDIKPANLVLDKSGVVKILDLGLARFFSDTGDGLTQNYEDNAVLGTADYMSPEQAINSSDVDIRADIYSLGATLYFLLTGRAPFEGLTVTQKLLYAQTRDPDPITNYRPDVPYNLVVVITRMMAKDPKRRYQLPAQVAEALTPWAASTTSFNSATVSATLPVRPADIGDDLPAIKPLDDEFGQDDTRNLSSTATPRATPVVVARPVSPGGAPTQAIGRAKTTTARPKAAAPSSSKQTRIIAPAAGQSAIRGTGSDSPTSIEARLIDRAGEGSAVRPATGRQPHVTVKIRSQKSRGDGPSQTTILAVGGGIIAVLALVAWLLTGDTRPKSESKPEEKVARSVPTYEPPPVRPAQIATAETPKQTGGEKTPAQPPAPPEAPQSPAIPESIKEDSILAGHRQAVERIAVTADGRSLFSCSHDATARFWDLSTGVERRIYRGHDGPVQFVSLSPDWTNIVSAGNDGQIRIWSITSSDEIARLKGHEGKVWCAIYSPDGSKIASCGADRTVRLWDAKTHEPISSETQHTSDVLWLAFLPNGSQLLSASWDGSIHRWDGKTGAYIGTLKSVHPPGATTVAVSPDGTKALTGGRDAIVRLHDLSTGEEVKKFSCAETVCVVAFSPDGNRALSAGADKLIHLWDLNKGEEIHRFRAHKGTVTSAAFLSNEKIASCSADSSIRIWTIPTR